LKKLKKEHAQKLQLAVQAQRSGQIPRYAELTAEAEALEAKIEELESHQA
jgi:cell division protein FtsB